MAADSKRPDKRDPDFKTWEEKRNELCEIRYNSSIIVIQIYSSDINEKALPSFLH